MKRVWLKVVNIQKWVGRFLHNLFFAWKSSGSESEMESIETPEKKDEAAQRMRPAILDFYREILERSKQ